MSCKRIGLLADKRVDVYLQMCGQIVRILLQGGLKGANSRLQVAFLLVRLAQEEPQGVCLRLRFRVRCDSGQLLQLLDGGIEFALVYLEQGGRSQCPARMRPVLEESFQLRHASFIVSTL